MITVEQFIEKKIAGLQKDMKNAQETIKEDKDLLETFLRFGDFEKVNSLREIIKSQKEYVEKIKQSISKIGKIGKIESEMSIERLVEIDKEWGNYDEEVDLLGWYGDVLALTGDEDTWEIEDLNQEIERIKSLQKVR
ncbi:hypothetical protein QUF86_20135 [Peribacillus sp. NJ11]|uniref:Uncharacterized protein n=1 Tax=Peribacillus simplex TaxID=1478 RepID=A0A9X8ZDG6_9BACI|nr:MULTISPECIES: hypothetical protein [Peribacillus]MDM5223004.1 hypothetical protein [Peribacillus sp. NJ11]TKH07811.1 hypothetical protein FC678_22120 [Peribacillus simplex]